MSRVIMGSVGMLGKACLNLNASVSVHGLDILHRALEEENRKGRGILTVCNHISVVDEPFIWGCLPWHQYFRPRHMRWTLGASDIMFTNPVFSAFFRAGQIIETFRGGGVHQRAIDDAVEKLNDGGWVHMFPEGKVNQPSLNPVGGLFRFKWGVGRMLMDATHVPTIIPMRITGFDAMMPEPRKSPKWLPKFGQNISITFGEPTRITERIEHLRISRKNHKRTYELEDEHEIAVRKEITQALQEEVEALGIGTTDRSGR